MEQKFIKKMEEKIGKFEELHKSLSNLEKARIKLYYLILETEEKLKKEELDFNQLLLEGYIAAYNLDIIVKNGILIKNNIEINLEEYYLDYSLGQDVIYFICKKNEDKQIVLNQNGQIIFL